MLTARTGYAVRSLVDMCQMHFMCETYLFMGHGCILYVYGGDPLAP